MTGRPASADAQALEQLLTLWQSQPRAASRQLREDTGLAIQVAATGAFYLSTEPEWPHERTFARMLLRERQSLARAYFQVQFLDRPLGQRLQAIMARSRLGTTDVLRALEVCACHNVADAVRLLHVLERHGGLLDRTRARISREAAEAYRTAHRAQAPTQPQYPDLIPVEQFRDFTKLNS